MAFLVKNDVYRLKFCFQVANFVNEEVAEYKRLVGGIQFIEAIPKSAAGKILRKDLKKKYEDEQR